MTVSLCTNCGSLKHGAWCKCPDCEASPFDGQASILLSDHNLTEEELRKLGKAVAAIRTTGHDEETRFHILMYFISRKWPKLLAIEIEALPEKLQETLESVYREHLQSLPGQDSPDVQSPPVAHSPGTCPSLPCCVAVQCWVSGVRRHQGTGLVEVT